MIRGTFYTYSHLTAPTRQAGLTTPLHDLSHLGLASILRDLNLDDKNSSLPPDPASLLISEHVQMAMLEFRRIVGRLPPPESMVKTLHVCIKSHDTTHASALQSKLQAKYRNSEINPEAAQSLYEQVVANTMALPARLPASHRQHAFLLIHNALPTKMRIGEHTQEVNVLCSFCGEAKERAKHIFGECKTVTAAGMIVRQQPDKTHFLALLDAKWDDFRFRSKQRPEVSTILLNFALAVWRSRRNFSHFSA